MAKRVREDEREKGRSSLRLPKLISEYARSHPRVPPAVQATGRVRETVLKTRKGAQRKRSRLHDDMVEGDEDNDRVRSKSQSESRSQTEENGSRRNGSKREEDSSRYT